MSVPTLIGRYRVGPRLGAGGYAVVWLAHDESLDTTIAIKVLAENWVDRAELRERFLAEARMLRRAASSRIVQVFDIGELPDGRPYFVMEHADRGTLSDRIYRGRLPLVEALRVTAEVARGAAELHRLDIVHRDLKPSNVLIGSAPDGGDRLLIADLGIAKNLAQGTALTLSVGSSGYMAPEQSTDARVDARADVYSLGVLGFHLVTGLQPGKWGPVLPPEGSDPGFPEPVRQLLTQAVALERDQRWPDAATLAERLDQLADEFEFGVQGDVTHPPMRPDPGAVGSEPQVESSLRSPSGPDSGSGLDVGSGLDSDSGSAPGSGHRPRPGRRSRSKLDAGSGRRAGSGMHAGAPAPPCQPPRGFSSRIRDRRVMLAVGLVLVALVWIEFRIILNSSEAESQTTTPAAKASPAAGSVSPLADGDHHGLLVASPKGKITFNLVNLLVGDEALTKCQQDFGPVPAKAVCRAYYFPRTETSPRTLRVDKDAAVAYVVNVDQNGVLFNEVFGTDVAKTALLSKKYQQGRLFAFRTKHGVFLGGSQEPLGCKDIDGITIDGRTEWMSRCVKQLGIR